MIYSALFTYGEFIMLQNDYVIRQIEIMVKYIAETVLGKNKKDYNITVESLYDTDNSGDDTIYLYQLVDNGEINLAENLLFDKIQEQKTVGLLETGLSFYIYINSKTDEFLEEHDFSRQEIIDGLNDLQKEYGLL